MLSKKQKAYMNVARFLATKSTMRHKHGAVVVKSGRVLGMGYNKRRNDPRNLNPGRHRYDSGCHAEMSALKNVSDPRGAIIFVARVNRSGNDLLSKPCEICASELKRLGIKKVIYTQ